MKMKFIAKESLCAFAVVILALVACNAAAKEKTRQDRITEIASRLPEKPSADGAPVSDRAKWGPLAASDAGKKIVAEAEKIAAEPVPAAPDNLYLEFSKNGNRSNFESCHFKRKRDFASLYVAECLEHKGRFISKIVEFIDSYCAMKSWTLPAHDGELECFKGNPHVDLTSADTSRELAFCISWLGDSIPEATRKKVYSEIYRRTFRPYLDHARGKRKIDAHWWFHGGNNWNSVCNSCVVRAALAIIPDRRLRAEFVMHAAGSVPYAIAGYTPDGYCSEGMGYWNYGYGHHLRMGLSIRAATGGKVDLFADPKTKKVMEYAYGFQLQSGKSPFFADGGGGPASDLLALGRQVWPDLVSTAAIKSPVFSSSTSLFSLRAFGQEPKPCAPTMDVLPPHTWFPDAQVLISRLNCGDGQGAHRLSIAIKGGHNAELHNHNDVGSYTVMMDGCEIAGDPGGEVYTRRTFSKDRYVSKMLNSYGHPVPVVAGRLQSAGAKYSAKVLKTVFGKDKDVIVLDIKGAYNVPELVSLVRTMTFDRGKETITITDKVKFSKPSAFEVPLVTYCKWEKTVPGNRFILSPVAPEAGGMEVKAVGSSPLKFKPGKVENPGKKSVERLAFSFAEPVTSASISIRFSCLD